MINLHLISKVRSPFAIEFIPYVLSIQIFHNKIKRSVLNNGQVSYLEKNHARQRCVRADKVSNQNIQNNQRFTSQSEFQSNFLVTQ